MQSIQLNGKEKLRHLLVWMIITLFLCILDPPQAHKAIALSIIEIAIAMLSYGVVYYSHLLYIFPKVMGLNIFKLILFSFIMLIIFLSINYFNVYYVSTILGDPSLFENEPWYNLGTVLLIFFFIIVTMAFGAFQTKQSIFKIEDQYEKERVLITKSFGFFQNQFNPHITFNMLNYCYGYILTESKSGAKAIELFSNMLRHGMSSKAHEPILLRKEIEYITDYINLHKLLDEAIQIKFEVIGKVSDQKILPRILICFIENAIKHGEIYLSNNPIDIEICITSTQLNLRVGNKKKLEPSIKKSGIGIKNVMQQMDLYYEKNYDLKISNNINDFLCELHLNIYQNGQI